MRNSDCIILDKIGWKTGSSASSENEEGVMGGCWAGPWGCNRGLERVLEYGMSGDVRRIRERLCLTCSTRANFPREVKALIPPRDLSISPSIP